MQPCAPGELSRCGDHGPFDPAQELRRDVCRLGTWSCSRRPARALGAELFSAFCQLWTNPSPHVGASSLRQSTNARVNTRSTAVVYGSARCAWSAPRFCISRFETSTGGSCSNGVPEWSRADLPALYALRLAQRIRALNRRFALKSAFGVTSSHPDPSPGDRDVSPAAFLLRRSGKCHVCEKEHSAVLVQCFPDDCALISVSRSGRPPDISVDRNEAPSPR